MSRNETDALLEMKKCRAAANQRGEHIPCDEQAGHMWAHGNSEHELIWISAQELDDQAVVLDEMEEMGL